MELISSWNSKLKKAWFCKLYEYLIGRTLDVYSQKMLIQKIGIKMAQRQVIYIGNMKRVKAIVFIEDGKASLKI